METATFSQDRHYRELRRQAQSLKLGISAVAGVYDPDFERLSGLSHSPRILTPTDENDLEVTMLASQALDMLLHEFGDSTLVEAFERGESLSVADYVERLSSEFGRLRFLNHAFGHCVDFDRLSPYRFVSSVDWSLDRTGLLAEYAALASIDQQTLAKTLSSHCTEIRPWVYSQGHDCVRILAQGLKRRIGRKQISEQDVGRVLRLAYSTEMLSRSSMYGYLCAIESTLPTPLFD